jgi:hypothetical protein
MPAIAVHGGAGDIPPAELTPERESAYRSGLEQALRAGQAILAAGGPSLDDLSPEERAEAEQMIAQMADVQRQIVAAPAAQLVANHIVGFYELAMIHLGQPRPRFDEAQLAIDAMAAVLEAVGSRLGEDGSALGQALNQAQVAFVQRREELAGGAD